MRIETHTLTDEHIDIAGQLWKNITEEAKKDSIDYLAETDIQEIYEHDVCNLLYVTYSNQPMMLNMNMGCVTVIFIVLIIFAIWANC